MSALPQELRFAVRNLRRRPAFTGALVAILALGIGANTAVFSIVNAVLLRPLGYGDTGRIAIVWEKRRKEGTRTNGVTPADYLDWRAQNHVFRSLTAHDESAFILSGQGEPERVTAVLASANMLDTWGVAPIAGRGFVPADEAQGAHVALLAWGFWQRRFGGQRSALRQTIRLNDDAYTVVGILPPDFRMYFGREPDLYLPLDLTGPRRLDRGGHDLLVVGRLDPGVSITQAQAEMDAISSRLERQWPAFNQGHSANVVPLRAQLSEGSRPLLLILSAAVLLVLLIACANAANLILARGLTRGRELAVREALGASRAKLIRLLALESLVPALVAGAAGCGLALVILRAIRPLLPRIAGVSFIPGMDAITIDTHVLLFAAAASIITGLACGVAPALRLSHADIEQRLRSSGHAVSPGRAAVRLRDGLLIAETALASVLLIGATLLLYSFAQLRRVNPGFQAQQRLSVEVILPPGADISARRNAGLRGILAMAASLPAVREAALTNYTPGETVGWRWGLRTDIHPEQRSIEDTMKIWMRVVSPGFTRVMGIPILEGRGLSDADNEHAAPVVLLSEVAARRYFAGMDAVGRQIAFGDQKIWRTVAGVTGGLKHLGLNRAAEPEIYVPFSQLDMPMRSATLILHTTGETGGLVAAVRQELANTDRSLAVGRVRTIDDLLAESTAPQRFDTVLIGGFAVIAFLLAIAGLATVITFLVNQQTREIAVRLALGASPARVVTVFTGHAVRLVAGGLALGAAGALALSGVLRAFLFGVSPLNPIAYVLPGLALLIAAAAAAFVPARRAARIDPMSALRHE